MGDNVIVGPWSHACVSSTTEGRATSDGQGTSSGHLSENQPITSSYLRAVKVVEALSTRSKKRQSPAASRPSVVKLRSREEAYAKAQAMRFDRSSDSMVGDTSGNVPTPQAISIGNIPLALRAGRSDKSSMPTVDEVRDTIRAALESRPKPLGAIEVITAMKKHGRRSYDRTYLSDFMKDKKRSLDQDFREDLAEFLGIEEDLLRITKPRPPVDVIRKGSKIHYYVTEHMKARGWDDKDLAGRMDGISEETVLKWRTSETLQEWQAAGFAIAFGFDDHSALTRPPVNSTKPARILKRKRA